MISVDARTLISGGAVAAAASKIAKPGEGVGSPGSDLVVVSVVYESSLLGYPYPCLMCFYVILVFIRSTSMLMTFPACPSSKD